jgi:hypothetical protein
MWVTGRSCKSYILWWLLHVQLSLDDLEVGSIATGHESPRAAGLSPAAEGWANRDDEDELLMKEAHGEGAPPVRAGNSADTDVLQIWLQSAGPFSKRGTYRQVAPSANGVQVHSWRMVLSLM